MLEKNEVVVNLSQLDARLAIVFGIHELELARVVFDSQLFVKSDYLLYCVPPSFQVTAFRSFFDGSLVSNISQALLKYVIPVSEILGRDAFEISRAPVVFVVSVFGSIKEKIEYLCARIHTVFVSYLTDWHAFRV